MNSGSTRTSDDDLVVAVPDEWQGILDPGERIIWQGRPVPKFRWEFRSLFEPLFYTFFTGFSIFWMAGASAAGGAFWMFGLIFFFVGSYYLFGQHYWAKLQRDNMFFTLTDRRAIIAKTVPFTSKRTLSSYPIDESTVLDLEDEGPTGSVFFAKETRNKRNRRGSDESYEIPIGFECIGKPREVLSKFRQIQSGQSARIEDEGSK